MRIAIVDDLKSDQQTLLEGLGRFCKEYGLQGEGMTFSSGESFVERGDCAFDIVFLDIYMKQLNGFETAQWIRQRNQKCLLIFTTTSVDFATRSYRVRAFDYLVKPYTYEELRETLELCRKELSLGADFLEVKVSRMTQKVRVAELLYVDYFNHYVNLHLLNGEVVRSQMPFEEIETKLAAYPQFILCKRNCLVNLDRVASAQKNAFVLENREELTYKRGQERELRQAYADYVFGKLGE